MTAKIKQKPSDYILDISRDYSIYVCSQRAIPNITDGLKDAQRKALWLIRNKSDKIKVISLAGELISSNLYLHGDASAANTISLLAAPYCNNVPLLDGIGAFGTRVSPVEGIGASRYIYVKRNEAAQKIMFTDLDIVPLKDNYDGSTKEPETFLPLIPYVLLNGVSGIAVGWSTEILPRRLSDLIDACVKSLEGKKIRRITPYFNLYNCGVKHVEDNTWEFSGAVEVLNHNTVRIIELPPDMILEKYREKLDKMEEEGAIRSYVDKSTDKIDITIKFKAGALKQWDNERIIDFLGLRSRKKERIVVIDFNGKSIKQYDSAENVVEEFVNWRLKFYHTRYQKKLDDDTYELAYWKGVKACFDAKLPDKLISKANKDAIIKEIERTTKTLKLDDKQIDKIANLPTYRWAKDFYKEVCNKIKELESNIKWYKSLLKDQNKLKDIYIEELKTLKTSMKKYC